MSVSERERTVISLLLHSCTRTQEDTGERRTTPDDLQGFWDMVSHQIDDVHCKFQRLEELEKNGWVIEDVPKKKPMKVCVCISLL